MKISKVSRIVIATAVFAGAAVAADQAAITVQCEGIAGFTARTWSFGVGNSQPAGKAAFSDLSVVKQFDEATTKLFAAVAAGTRFEKVTLTQRDPATKQAIVEVVLERVRVSNFQIGGTAASLEPAETVTFAFDKITVTYYGSAGRMVAGWDLTRQTKL